MLKNPTPRKLNEIKEEWQRFLRQEASFWAQEKNHGKVDKWKKKARTDVVNLAWQLQRDVIWYQKRFFLFRWIIYLFSDIGLKRRYLGYQDVLAANEHWEKLSGSEANKEQAQKHYKELTTHLLDYAQFWNKRLYTQVQGWLREIEAWLGSSSAEVKEVPVSDKKHAAWEEKSSPALASQNPLLLSSTRAIKENKTLVTKPGETAVDLTFELFFLCGLVEQGELEGTPKLILTEWKRRLRAHHPDKSPDGFETENGKSEKFEEEFRERVIQKATARFQTLQRNKVEAALKLLETMARDTQDTSLSESLFITSDLRHEAYIMGETIGFTLGQVKGVDECLAETGQLVADANKMTKQANLQSAEATREAAEAAREAAEATREAAEVTREAAEVTREAAEAVTRAAAAAAETKQAKEAIKSMQTTISSMQAFLIEKQGYRAAESKEAQEVKGTESQEVKTTEDVSCPTRNSGNWAS